MILKTLKFLGYRCIWWNWLCCPMFLYIWLWCRFYIQGNLSFSNSAATLWYTVLSNVTISWVVMPFLFSRKFIYLVKLYQRKPVITTTLKTGFIYHFYFNIRRKLAIIQTMYVRLITGFNPENINQCRSYIGSNFSVLAIIINDR